MRKIILNLAVSLDGLIEGPNGEYDWCFTDQDYGMTEFLKSVDTIFFGRKSYELLMNTDGDIYPDKSKYVFSNTLQTVSGNARLVSGNIEEKISAIKKQHGKNIWLFGGASLTTTLINAGLVDELQLSIHPVILGKGKPLFQHIKSRLNLHLTGTKNYTSGLVQLFHRLENS